jgi:Zn-dependent peptidase ImmA (M78 family)
MKDEIEKAERFALCFLIPTLSFSVGLIVMVMWGTLK